MKKTMFILLFFISTNTFAQKALILNYDDVVKIAKGELDSSMYSGELKEFSVKNNIKGEFIMDITLHEKGKVLSVFVVSNSTGNIKSQSLLMDFLRAFVFHFKLPQGKKYKFQYDFNFPN